MDRRGQQRLIGAAILVALAVVVVPELLSGPKLQAPAAAESPQAAAGAPEPVRNVTMDLATSKPALLAVNAPQAPPAPSAATSTEAAPAPARPAQTLGLTQAPPPLETAAPPPTSMSGYAVQLGSFAHRIHADNLLHQLKAQGYAAYESTEGAGSAARYRVRVGPLNDRAAAEKTIAKLKAEGHDSTLVTPR